MQIFTNKTVTSTGDQAALNETLLASIGEIATQQEELLDVDIDRSEFDKYLSGYATTGVTVATAITSSSAAAAPNSNPYYDAAPSSGAHRNYIPLTTCDHHHSGHNNNNNSKINNIHHHECNLMKSEPCYETNPGSSLSSALADVRSVYYDC